MISLPSRPTVATFFSKIDAKNKTPLGALKCNELQIKFCGDIIGPKIRWRCSKQRKDLKCPAKFYTDLSAIYLTYFDDMYSHKCKQSQQVTQLDSALKSARLQQLSPKKSQRTSSPGEFEWKFPTQSPAQEETEAVHSLLVQFNQVASDYMNKVGLPNDAKEIINSLNEIISPQQGNPSSANAISPFTLNEHQTTQKLQTNQSQIPCDFISSNKKRLRTTSEFGSPTLSFKRHCTESERSRDYKSSQSPSLNRLEESLNHIHLQDTFKIQPLQCPIVTSTVEFASQEVQTDPLPPIEEAPSKIPLKSLNLETFKKVFMRYTSRFTQLLGCAVRDNFQMREIIKDELVRDDAVLTYLKALYEDSTLDDYNICYIKTLMEKLEHKYLPEFTVDVEREFCKYVDIQFTFFDKPLEHDATVVRNRLYREGNESAANTQLDEEKYSKTFTLIANEPLVVLKREYVYPL